MIKASVQLRDINRGGQINMSMEEYVAFIEEQAEILGITSPITTEIVEVDLEKVSNINELVENFKRAARGKTNGLV